MQCMIERTEGRKEDSQDDYVQEEEIEFKISRERYEYYKGRFIDFPSGF